VLGLDVAGRSTLSDELPVRLRIAICSGVGQPDTALLSRWWPSDESKRRRARLRRLLSGLVGRAVVEAVMMPATAGVVPARALRLEFTRLLE
jgi:hypothetical protein